MNPDDDEVFQDYGSPRRKPGKMDVLVKLLSIVLSLINISQSEIILEK